MAFSCYYILFLIGILLISGGCSSLPQTGKEVQNEDVDDKTQENIVFGKSLKQMGLTILINDSAQFTDPNRKNYKPTFEVVNSDVCISCIKEAGKLKGSMSSIDLYFSDSGIDMNQLAVKYLQGFQKEETMNEQNVVEINSKKYKFAELRENKIFEDERWVIYELSDKLDVADIDEKIHQLSMNGVDGYDYTWLKEMYRYLDLNLKEMIIYKALASTSADLAGILFQGVINSSQALTFSSNILL